MAEMEKSKNKTVETKFVAKLFRPQKSGWERYSINLGKELHVVYAFCGQRFYDYNEIHRYLMKTESPLSIDCFTFDTKFNSSRSFDSLQNGNTVLIQDVSSGREKIPVRVIGKKCAVPRRFEYINRNRFTNSIPSFLREPYREACCNCTDNCADKTTCACWINNIQKYNAYSRVKADPVLFGYQFKRLSSEIPTGIFECHEGCKCTQQCFNRVAQQTVSHQLEVFKTESYGYGVRCVNDIPAGAFVCCYFGEIMTYDVFDEKASYPGDDDKYTFSCLPSELPQPKKRNKTTNNSDEEALVIDGKYRSNIGRFFNHSCAPNMWVQNVYVDTHDLRFPRIAFFTSQVIVAGEELTYDYNYEAEMVPGRELYCQCGAKKCRGRLL